MGGGGGGANKVNFGQHFQSVFRMSELRADLPASNTDGADAMFDELNAPIMDEEVRVAISSLKKTGRHAVMIMSQQEC